MIKIYYLKIPNNFEFHKISNYMLDLLPNIFQQNILNKANIEDRWISFLSKYLVVKIYGYDKINNELFLNQYGKPLFHKSKKFFNISHSSKYIVIATSTQEQIGIDIEKHTQIDLINYKSIFNRNEYKLLLSIDNFTKCFFEIWTYKESVLKCSGYGLNDNIAEINWLDRNTNKNFHYKYINKFIGYSCCICSDSKIERIDTIKIDFNKLYYELI
jgi:4'-phosphopantetheinyl transferase